MADEENSEGQLVGRRSSASSSHSVDSDECRRTGSARDAQLTQVRILVDFMSRMKVSRPEVLRATSAYHALESRAAALRQKEGDFFAKSREVPKIQQFWSHSWHSTAWAKCLTLLVLNNGLAAICAGNVCALLGIVLFHFHVLPGFDRHWEGQGNSSVWSSVLGAAGTMLTLACWRSGKEVFLDRICISKTREDLKAEAICSLGGILDKSESMLVLWNASFAERLWCMFEIAAFLKSKERRERPLVICPTLTGPVSFAVFATATIAFIPILVLPVYVEGESFPYTWHITGFATAGVAGAYAACHVMRGLYRSIEVMQRQLLSLQVSKLKCSCCSRGLCVSSGGRIFCDRQVISECIAAWFGSTENFEEYIRNEVVDVITTQLERNAFSDAWSFAVLSPAQWAIFDIVQYDVRRPSPNWGRFMAWLSIGLSVFMICPLLMSWCKYLAYRLRHESSSRCGEVLTNSLMILSASPVIIFGVGSFLIAEFVPGWNLKPVVVVAFLLPGWALMCLFRRRGKGYLSQFIWQRRLVQGSSSSKHGL